MSDRIFPQWDGRFVIHDGEVALRVFDIPWFWSQVAQAALCAQIRLLIEQAIRASAGMQEVADWVIAVGAPDDE